MPVPSDISQLSTTPGSNSPSGSESPATFDDYMRTFAAFIAQLRDGAVSLTGNQTIAGVKTFSSPIVGNATNVTGIVAIANGGTGSSTGDGLAQTGDVKMVARSTAPAGWVKANGGTIGNAASGGTARANVDTEALFTLLWTDFSNTILPIQTSTGSASTRGASAAADYAANKRLPIFDSRGEGLRGWDDGKGTDAARVLGSIQLDAMQGHRHAVIQPTYGTYYGGSGNGQAGVAYSFDPIIIGDPITNGTNGTPRTASETRMRNIAFLVVIKL